MADEFSAELAEGVAYVAGNDDELRPVVVIIFFNFSFVILILIYLCKFNVYVAQISDISNQAGLPEIPFSKTVS